VALVKRWHGAKIALKRTELAYQQRQAAKSKYDQRRNQQKPAAKRAQQACCGACAKNMRYS